MRWGWATATSMTAAALVGILLVATSTALDPAGLGVRLCWWFHDVCIAMFITVGVVAGSYRVFALLSFVVCCLVLDASVFLITLHNLFDCPLLSKAG